MDLYHQYGPLFAELYDRVVEGRACCTPGAAAEAASSATISTIFPALTVLIFLFNKADISFAITALVIVKCMASAVTLPIDEQAT